MVIGNAVSILSGRCFVLLLVGMICGYYYVFAGHNGHHTWIDH